MACETIFLAEVVSVLCTRYYVLCTMYYVLCTMYYVASTWDQRDLLQIIAS